MGRLKKTVLLLYSVYIIVINVSCSNTKMERLFYNKYAYYFSEDGWSYCFKYQYFVDGHKNNNSIPYAFNAINLRYAFSKDLMSDSNAEMPAMKMQVLGNDKNAPALNRDMLKIADFLCYSKNDKPSVEDLLATDKNKLSFEMLDVDIFYNLMTQALTEPQREYSDKYIEFPSYAMLAEQTFRDGYKFQIGFRTGNGYVDVLYIDVLYQTGERFNQYVQLSDIIEKGEPTEKQSQLWQFVHKITNDILSDNDFTSGINEYGQTVIDGVNLGRLAVFLTDINRQSFGKYT